jgi:hypothetical protein
MSSGAARRLAALMLACALATPAAPAEPPREVHGMADAYAGEDVALAWAVLRGADEAATVVVLSIVADPQRYGSVSVTGSNPFSGQSKVLLATTPTRGLAELRVARTHFAAFPRTELRFFGSASSDAPLLVVYFLGVPDTTPEFASDASLEAFLSDRMTRLRAGANRSQ